MDNNIIYLPTAMYYLKFSKLYSKTDIAFSQPIWLWHFIHYFYMEILTHLDIILYLINVLLRFMQWWPIHLLMLFVLYIPFIYTSTNSHWHLSAFATLDYKPLYFSTFHPFSYAFQILPSLATDLFTKLLQHLLILVFMIDSMAWYKVTCIYALGV